ncbi:unnamed protein product [Nesidiocoris tenuis]|uniref:Uncharacterized protein n=1 Tax=Nesidiocoris tenuis TaxID=355587 RepID=A0A6H5HGC3_9HEMI|nr:unnamed protein product [Nesidiocoris tenuis]
MLHKSICGSRWTQWNTLFFYRWSAIHSKRYDHLTREGNVRRAGGSTVRSFGGGAVEAAFEERPQPPSIDISRVRCGLPVFNGCQRCEARRQFKFSVCVRPGLPRSCCRPLVPVVPKAFQSIPAVPEMPPDWLSRL